MDLEDSHINAILRNSEIAAEIGKRLGSPDLPKRWPDNLTEEEYENLLDTVQDVWRDTSPVIREFTGYGPFDGDDYEEFPLGVAGVRGAYYVFAQEFDDEGPFRTQKEAIEHLKGTYCEYLEKP